MSFRNANTNHLYYRWKFLRQETIRHILEAAEKATGEFISVEAFNTPADAYSYVESLKKPLDESND